MKKLLFIPLICISFLPACSDTQPKERTDGFSEKSKTAEDSVMNDVMEAHDVAMAKMGTLKNAKSRIDSVGKAGLPDSLKAPLKHVRIQLDTAEEHMERWMTEFNMDSAQSDGPGRMTYLLREREKISAARDLMLKNIAEADSLLKKL